MNHKGQMIKLFGSLQTLKKNVARPVTVVSIDCMSLCCVWGWRWCVCDTVTISCCPPHQAGTGRHLMPLGGTPLLLSSLGNTIITSVVESLIAALLTVSDIRTMKSSCGNGDESAWERGRERILIISISNLHEIYFQLSKMHHRQVANLTERVKSQ